MWVCGSVLVSTHNNKLSVQSVRYYYYKIRALFEDAINKKMRLLQYRRLIKKPRHLKKYSLIKLVLYYGWQQKQLVVHWTECNKKKLTLKTLMDTSKSLINTAKLFHANASIFFYSDFRPSRGIQLGVTFTLFFAKTCQIYPIEKKTSTGSVLLL